jgi:hypothetical protein
VVAPNGVNMRGEPSPDAVDPLLAFSLRVTIVEGPVDAAGFRWWKLDDGEGNVGWAIENDGETDTLSPQLGEPEPVDRSPRVGERVRVTMSAGGQLSVRETPGTDATIVVRDRSRRRIHGDRRPAGSQRLYVVPDSLRQRRC